MKRKNTLSENATKEDIENLESSLKKDMRVLETRFDIKLDRTKQEIDENAQQYRDQILTSNDKLAMQLETMTEELGLGNLQMKREIEDHEKRIKHLEKVQQTA